MRLSNSIDRKVQIEGADPSALGLLGLAVVTAVAASQKLGITQGLSWVIPWAIFMGASAQFVAAILDFFHKNVFGVSIFGAFAFFWYGVAMSWAIKMGALGPELAAGVDGSQIGYAFLCYFIYAVAGTVCATETNKALFIDMVFIDILLLGLTLDALGLGGHWAHEMAAYAEVCVSAVSLYAACATFFVKFFGYQLLPLGAPLGIFKKA